MDVLILRQSPIPPADLERIAAKLRERSVLCTAFNPSANWYDPFWYAHEQAVHGTNFTLLLDRNVYSRLVQLANCESQAPAEDVRWAAAVLCFAKCCGLRLDCHIAVLEHELDSGDPAFATEYSKFQRVWKSVAAHRRQCSG